MMPISEAKLQNLKCHTQELKSYLKSALGMKDKLLINGCRTLHRNSVERTQNVCQSSNQGKNLKYNSSSLPWVSSQN